jgi:hypothetical protein
MGATAPRHPALLKDRHAARWFQLLAAAGNTWKGPPPPGFVDDGGRH